MVVSASVSTDTSSQPRVIKLESALEGIHERFSRPSNADIIRFFTTNDDLVERLVPVDSSKKPVVVGGTKLDSCRMSMKGLKTVLNGYKKPVFIDGVNLGAGLNPYGASIVCSGIALRHRFQSIAIDIDLNFFGNIVGAGNESECPAPLIEWVIEHLDCGLAIRGNRARITLIFLMAEDLKDFIDSEFNSAEGTVHKRIYSIVDTMSGKVEVSFGSCNNTVTGSHPQSGYYQSIFPENDEFQLLPLDNFLRLLAILDEFSYSTKEKVLGLGEGRSTLSDCWEVLQPLCDIVTLKYRIDASFNFPKEECGLTLDIRKYLNSSTVGVLDGKIVFDGDNLQKAKPDDDGKTVCKGNRAQTFRFVGSDVKQIASILDYAGLNYDRRTIKEIFQELWNITDSSGDNEGEEFMVGEAKASFYSDHNLGFKPSYLAAMANVILVDSIATIRAQDPGLCQVSRKKSSDDTGIYAVTSEFAKDLIKKANLNKIENPPEEGEEVIENADANFIEELLNQADQAAETDEESEAEAIMDSESAIETSTQTRKEVQANEKYLFQNDAEIRDIIPSLYRKRVDKILSTKLRGYAHPFLGTTCAVKMSMMRHVTVKNIILTDKKEMDFQEFETSILPFMFNIAESGAGKSLVSKIFRQVTRVLNIVYQDVPKTEIDTFRKALCDKQGKLKSQQPQEKTVESRLGKPDDSIPNRVEEEVPDTDDLDEEVPEKLSLGKQLQRQEVYEYVSTRTKDGDAFVHRNVPYFVGDPTESAIRDKMTAMEDYATLRMMSGGDFLASSYKHPIAIVLDEIKNWLENVYNNRQAFYGTTSYFCDRKDNAPLEVIRTGGDSFVANAGMTVVGNVTRRAFIKLIDNEITEGTDGFLPRFNFCMTKACEENLYDPDKLAPEDRFTFPKPRRVSDKDYLAFSIAGAAAMGRFLSIDPHLYNWGVTTDGVIEFDHTANEEMARAIVWERNKRSEFKADFSEYGEFITSFMMKHRQEVCIYAGALCISDALANLFKYVYQRTKVDYDISLEEMVDIFKGSAGYTFRDKKDLFARFRSSLIVGYEDFVKDGLEMPTHITGEDVIKANILFSRSVASLRMLLTQNRSIKKNDADSRFSESRKMQVIKETNAGYAIELEIKAIAKAIMRAAEEHRRNIGDSEEYKAQPYFTPRKVRNKTSASCREIYDHDKPKFLKRLRWLEKNGFIATKWKKNGKGEFPMVAISPEYEIDDFLSKLDLTMAAHLS